MADLKGKKVACLIVLPHHTRFLLPVAKEVRERGGEVIFFLTLADYPFERDLRNKGETYRFLSEYMTEDVKGKMDATYWQVADEWLDRVFSWHGFSFWSLKSQDWTLQQIVEEYFCIERFIEVEKPDMFLTLHERNRWGKIMGYLARKNDISYVTFQEGDYTTGERVSFSVHTEYSTADLLWGEATREKLLGYGCSRDKMVLVGNTHLDEAVRTYNDPGRRSRTRREIGVSGKDKMILFLVDLTWGVVISEPVWTKMVQGLDGFKCVFKWHPNVSRKTFEEVEEIFRKQNANVSLLYDQDSYALLGAADFCVVLGHTTLALEGLAFGRPLFATPTWEGAESQYVKLGVAQPLEAGDWTPLIETDRSGVPQEVKKQVETYLERSCYRLDGKATKRAVDVIEYLLEKKMDVCARLGDRTPSRETGCSDRSAVSFVVPSGSSREALLGTVQSLADNVRFENWEIVLVINDEGMEPFVEVLEGDVRVVRNRSASLAELYAAGAKEASGDRLIFLRPGLLFVRGDGLLNEFRGVTGGILVNPDQTSYCRGIGFDYNGTPYRMTENGKPVEAVGGGLLAIARDFYEEIGGFDPDVANHLAEVDLSVRAQRAGGDVTLATESVLVNLLETFYGEDLHGAGWKNRLAFYGKWPGRLPKDEDYPGYAGDLLKV